MGSKIVIFFLVGIIAIQFYSGAMARADDDTVGELDCIIRDIVIDGFEIGRIDAVGYLTDID